MIRVLQLGQNDWSQLYKFPNYIEFFNSECFDEIPKVLYDLVFIERTISEAEVDALMLATKAHCLYVIEGTYFNNHLKQLFTCKEGKIIKQDEVQDFLLTEARNYFPKPYGEKYSFVNLSVAQGFKGNVTWNGNYSLVLDGEYSDDFEQVAYWRNTVPIYEGQAIDYWLEYKKDPDVEIQLVLTQFKTKSLSEMQQKWVFSEEEMKDIVVADNQLPEGPVFASLMAKGKGKLEIIALHDRFSRRGHGLFLPGGERFVTSDREEIFYYFDPGDMKPPLNVYFSGYKTMEGFEGYYMMRKMGCPFLLIAEPRLDGGCFYIGSEEYEKGLLEIIQKHLNKLGFSNQELILSGLSMGTFGALYYGCDLSPHAMILGKPLASIGDVAINERLHRPGGFPTSLDVLNYMSGSTSVEAIKVLNDRFWNKFRQSDFSRSKFVVSYMIEDDYDATAYNKLISNMPSDGVQVYGKGVHGRHNDATGPIASWFKKQYEQILINDFSRRI